MKLLIILLILVSSTNIFAGRIVKNINWDNSTGNKSGAAIATSERKSASIIYNKYISDDKDNNSDDYQSNTKNIVLFNKTKDVSYEVTARLMNSGFAGKDKDTKSVLGYFGKKSNNFNIGLYAYHFQSESSNQHELGTSITQKSNDVVFGAGIRTSYWSESDKYHQYIYAGLGKEEKNKTLEAYIAYRPEQNSKKNGTPYEVDKYIVAVATSTLIFENFQLVPHISYVFDEDKEGDEKFEKTEFYMFTSIEFRLSDSIYIGGVFGRKDIHVFDKDTANDDYEELVYVTGINARYKIKNYQAEVDFIQYDKNKDYDTGGDDDEDDKSLSITATYFF
jgi:hypothetical protein